MLMAPRLFKAAWPGETEANFLEVLRGCGEAEVKYLDSGWTVLMRMAIHHDWPEVAAAVINRGCDVNVTNNHGQTALHVAGYSNHRETARVLLERGTDRTIRNQDGETAAENARRRGHADLAAYIDGFTLKPAAPATPAAAQVDRLYNASLEGAEENFLEVLKGCGEAEVKHRGYNNNTVLTGIACGSKDWPKAAAAVIERGCDVNAVDKHGDTALHTAGLCGHREVARVLLEHGADRTIKNKKGETAAEGTRNYGREDLAAYIDKVAAKIELEAKREANLKKREEEKKARATGADAVDRLYKAAESGTEANFLKVLTGCGEAEVKYRDRDGWTVLIQMAASDHEWPKAAAAVIERGCDVDETSKQGWTALHCAGNYNRRETVRVLLEKGADRTITDKDGKTAAEYARSKGKEDIAAYITGFSLKPRPPLQRGLSAIPSDDAPRASSIAGLVELLREVKLEEHLPRATKWCVDNGADSVAVIIEVGEGTSFVAAVFPDLKPIKKKQLLQKLGADAPSAPSVPPPAARTASTKAPTFKLFISHATKDDSHEVFKVVQAFMAARDVSIFNPTTHLSHVKEINKEAMQGAVKRSSLVVAALSDGFFESSWCAAEIAAAKEAGIKAIPVYSGDEHGANQVDRWVKEFKGLTSDRAKKFPEFAYVFNENARDVLNKQNPESTKKTLGYLASMLE